MIHFNECSDISEFFFKWQELFLDDLDLSEKDDLTYSKYESVTRFFIDYLAEKKPFNKIEEIDHRAIHKFIKYREDEAKRLKEENKGFQYSTKISYKTILKIFLDFIEDESNDFYTFAIKWKRLTFKKEIKEKKHIDNQNLQTILNYLDNLIKRSNRIKNFNNLNKNQVKEIKNLEYVYMLNFTYKLGIYLGLRATEICKLKLSDFSKPYKLNSNDIFMDVLIHGKGSKERVLPILYKNIKKEHQFFIKKRRKDDILFRQITGGNLTRNSLYNYFDEVGKMSGTNERGCHILRHTFTHKMTENDVDLADAQDMLGHSDASTTRIYFKRNPKRMRNVAIKINQ